MTLRSDTPDDHRGVRDAVAWPLVGPPAAVLLAFAVVGTRNNPPAADVARWCFGAAAMLLTLKLLIWITTARRSFGRPHRLAAFVMLCAIGMGWYAAGQWVGQRQFDYLVAAQDADLKLTVTELSAEILAFLAERSREAPPRPRPGTWDQDSAEIMRYQIGTEREFDRRFEKQVRATHDVLSLLGIRDKDLDVFYAHPTDPFQMRVVATRLASLAPRLVSP
jgi:hypothetical protein